MSRVDFGKVISSLRKEFKNEFDDPMTQKDLADGARIPLITLQKIEQGRQANLKPDLLLSLANCLNIPSYARNNFFLASLGLDGNEIIEYEIAQPFFEQIQKIISQMQTPASITNSFGDLILANPAFLQLLDIDPLKPGGRQMPQRYNLYRILFSPEFEDLHRMMGDSYASFARRRVLMLKAATLKYRNTKYYQELIPELNHYPEFKRHWQSSVFLDEDIYLLSNIFKINHPRWGQLSFITFPVQVLTEESDLLLFTYQPMDGRTVEVCAQMVKELGTQPVKISDWVIPPLSN